MARPPTSSATAPPPPSSVPGPSTSLTAAVTLALSSLHRTQFAECRAAALGHDGWLPLSLLLLHCKRCRAGTEAAWQALAAARGGMATGEGQAGVSEAGVTQGSNGTAGSEAELGLTVLLPAGCCPAVPGEVQLPPGPDLCSQAALLLHLSLSTDIQGDVGGKQQQGEQQAPGGGSLAGAVP
ncbi:hypothetical protein HaLaN_04363 [Haematococcus lacustris]|uniref:Uncharacterized protein n=1 Tax=Haematococcus lacustris TaxID=44745 RepID=A0A699YQS2_HAELA|nr:hypothetical protein HaLaN_04363 [Haematococcus lacustris]